MVHDSFGSGQEAISPSFWNLLNRDAVEQEHSGVVMASGKRRRLEGSEPRNGDVIEMIRVRLTSVVNPEAAGAKRPRRMRFDEDDISMPLDAGHVLEKDAMRISSESELDDPDEVVGADMNLVRAHKDNGLVDFERDGDLDVRAMAPFAMATVKEKYRLGQVYGGKNTHSLARDSIAVSDDILTHLDDGYKLENRNVHSRGGRGSADYDGVSGEDDCGEFLDGDVNRGCDDKDGRLTTHDKDNEVDIRGLAVIARDEVKTATYTRPKREHRLAQRKYWQHLAATKKAKADNKSSSANPSTTTNAESGVEPLLTPRSEADRAKVLRRLQRALGPEGLDECVCVSCDRLFR